MNNSFIELSDNQLLDIDGGVNWLKVAGGALIIGGSIASGGVIPAVVGAVGGVVCVIDGI